MALFKIYKGSKNDLGKIDNITQYVREGFAYFTPDDGKFYIDTAGSNEPGENSILAQIGVNRIPLNAVQADYVENNFILKFANGNTENTNLYTFNGSATKQLNIQPGDGISFTSASNSLTIGINASEINTGILSTDYGGTGNDAYVANRLIYSETATKLNTANNIHTDGNTLNFLKDDGSYVLISNKYNNTSYALLRDEHNGNISLNASGEGILLGSSNTKFTSLSNRVKVYSLHSFKENEAISAPGWIRIAVLELNDNNYFGQAVFDFIITRTYSAGAPETYAIRVTAGWQSYTLTQLSGNIKTQRLTEFRIARDDTEHKAYFEIYLNATPSSNTIFITTIDYTNKSTLQFLAQPETKADSELVIKNLKLKTAAISSTESLFISSISKGLFLTDSTNTFYGAIYNNNDNLWIGATATNENIHTGQLYLHAGKNASDIINRSAYLSIGDSDNTTTSTNYVIAYGSGGSSSQPIYINTYGKVQSITGALGNDITGNAATATAANITSTDNAIVRFDGTTGQFQNSQALVDDNGGITSKSTVTIGAGYFIIKPYSSTYDTSGTDPGISFYYNHNRSGYNADTLITTKSLQAANFYGALKGNADTATALTSNAGGLRNPIYFTNGKPAAGEITFDTLTANRLMWTTATDTPYAGYHYADTTHISIADSTLHSDYNLYVNGNAKLKSHSFVGAKDAYNDTNAGWYLGADGTIWGTHASSGAKISLYGNNQTNWIRINPTTNTSNLTMGAVEDRFEMPKLRITSTADIGGKTSSSPPLSIGTLTSTHLEIDTNEILAKNTDTTTGTLYLQDEDGLTSVAGSKGLQIKTTSQNWLPAHNNTFVGGIRMSDVDSAGGAINWIKSANTNSGISRWWGMGTVAHSWYVVSSASSRGSTAGYDQGMLFHGDSGRLELSKDGYLTTGNLTIGGTSETDAGKTIISSSTLYLKTSTSASIIFNTNSTNRARFDPSGHFKPESNNTYTLGISGTRWKSLFVGNADSYGGTTQPIWWNAGVPTAITTAIATAYGGTGNTSYTASRLVYTNTATKLATGNIVSDGNYISKVTFLSVNEDHQTGYNFEVNGSTNHKGNIYMQEGTARATAPSSNQWRYIFFHDKDASNNYVAYIGSRHDTSNTHGLFFATYSSEGTGSTQIQLMSTSANRHYTQINTHLRLINNSSNDADDAVFYLENKNSSDWAQKILLDTFNYGLYIQSSGLHLLKVGTNDILHVSDHATDVTARRVDVNGRLDLHRSTNINYGYLSFYASSYATWIEYMSGQQDGSSPQGGKPGVLGNVTSWARRSIVEKASGYGWIWEYGTNTAASATTTVSTTPVMALSSNDGTLEVAGLIKSTKNSNTVTIGSQNASFTHIYNSADIPFIFNKSVLTAAGDLGNTSYPWNNIYLGKGTTRHIYFVGSKATTSMIRFLNETSTTYGNGISIGGGGLTIIGGGESASNFGTGSWTAETEETVVLADNSIWLEAGANTIANRIGFQINGVGNLIPVKAEALNDNAQNIGATNAKLANIYATTFHGTVNGDVYEDMLLWGGHTVGTNSWSPIDAVLNDYTRGNGFAMLPAANITVEHSTNAGSSWTTTSVADLTKRNLVTNDQSIIRIVASGNVPQNANPQLRITIKGSGSVYFQLKKIHILISTQGSSGCKVTIKGSLNSAPTTFNQTICTNVAITGWAGWNSITCNHTVGTGNDQIHSLQFIFTQTSVSDSYVTSGFRVYSIFGYGYMKHNFPSQLAKWSHAYTINGDGDVTFPTKLYGAVWNDYAEFRASKDNLNIEPGRVVYETGEDSLTTSFERLMRGCNIISDTYGFSLGESENTQLPIAVSGRVLAYPYEGREKFKDHIGWPVCSGPNGTVSIMTEEEEIKYPSRIIGTISAVPDYEIWHGGTDIKVNGRVWIKVR